MESLSVTAVKYWCWWAAGDHEWFLFAQQKGENEGKKVLKDFFHSSREHQETTKSTRTWNFFRLIRGDQIRTGFFFFYLFIKQELNICITSLGKKPHNLLFCNSNRTSIWPMSTYLYLGLTASLSHISIITIITSTVNGAAANEIVPTPQKQPPYWDLTIGHLEGHVRVNMLTLIKGNMCISISYAWLPKVMTAPKT